MDMELLNFSEFGKAEFDEITWVKDVVKKYRKSASKGNDDAFLEQLRLDVYEEIRKTNVDVEESMGTVIPVINKVTKDLKSIQAQTVVLKNKVAELRAEFMESQRETGSCMAKIEELNELQEKLESEKISLQESDGWGNLLIKIEDCFEKQDLQSISDNMAILQRSLEVQEALPGHTERQSQVEDFKNRMEAIISPFVVQAFVSNNLEKSQQYAQMFDSINRKPQMLQYYRAVHKKSIQQKWRELVDLSASSATNDNYCIELFDQFYDYLIGFYQKQVKWCVSVFGPETSNSEPISIFIDTLPLLQPTRESQILKNLKETGNKLEFLQNISDLNLNFGKKFKTALISPLEGETLDQLASEFFDCFTNHVTKEYSKVEEQFLNSKMESLKLGNSTTANTLDIMHELEHGNKKIFEMLHDSCKRCTKITCNYEVASLIVPFENTIKTFLKNYTKIIHRVHLSVRSDENWSLMQSCLSILQNLADVQKRVIGIAENVAESILNLKTETSDGNLFNRHMKNIKHSKLHTMQNKFNQQMEFEKVLIIFPKIMEEIQSLLTETHEMTINILLAPIEDQLKLTSDFSDSTSADDLPSFSFAPQENITQIGQYLLTLPQHLEPLLLAPSKLLQTGLEMCNDMYSKNIPCADILLSLLVEQCCHLFQNRILLLKSINSKETKQLAVDIEYLKNIIEEDLGLATTLHLNQTLILLQASQDSYLQLSSGCEPRLVTAIRQMRNIISTSNE